MNIGTLIFINLFAVLLVMFTVIYTVIRMRKIEEKSIDVSAQDVITFVEQMREMVQESERAAETMDSSIRDREAVLEDLNSLVENRIRHLESIIDSNRELFDSGIADYKQSLHINEIQESSLKEEIATLNKKLEAELAERKKLEDEIRKNKKMLHDALEREKEVREQLINENKSYDLLIQELKEQSAATLQPPTPIIQQPIPAKIIKRPSNPVKSQEPIVAARPTIVAQPTVKSTEEVLRTRTEPILSKQIQDRIPVDTPKIIKSRTPELSGVKIISAADTVSISNDTSYEKIQKDIYKMLFEGLSEDKIALKLNISVDEVERYLNIKK